MSHLLKTFESWRSLFHPNHENSDIRRRDPRNSRRLTQRGWLYLRQFLASLGAKAGNFGVVDPAWDLLVFKPFQLGNLQFLPCYVPLVFQSDFDLLDNFGMQAWIPVCQLRVGDLRSPQHLRRRLAIDPGFLQSIEFGFDCLPLFLELLKVS